MKMTLQEKEALSWASEGPAMYEGKDTIAARILAGYINRSESPETFDPIMFIQSINMISDFLREQAVGGNLDNTIEAAEQMGKLQAGMNIINSVIASDSFWEDYSEWRDHEES